ncbi:MAG: alanine--glyoxylate aminotransferase family protein [Planctomycetota bacterium]|jgi:predicted phosphoserine aminotransferase|nr:alanine--glyoxylate aminotransferase family protein [Planctomycetota bacterium]
MKLFIPGPTQVHPDILAEMAHPAIGHRTPECARLWAAARAGLSRLMFTQNEVLMLTAPASAMMEATIRNLVQEHSLHVVNGAFSKRWFEIAKSNGKQAVAVDIPWGSGIDANGLRAALESAKAEGKSYEVVTVVHNETSTGTVTPLEPLAEVLLDFPETLLCVDTVSSMAGAPVRVDDWKLDVCLFGLQKCLALPAGMAIAAVSPRAMERAATVPNRGWVLDFLRLAKGNEKEQSPTTPSTAHLYALVAQLNRIEEEGMENRWARHAEMAAATREWAAGHGWLPYPQEGNRSDTVSCIARSGGPDFVPALEALKAEELLVSNGYGDLKGKTFRIGHMGEHDMNDLTDLLQRFDAAMNAEVQA